MACRGGEERSVEGKEATKLEAVGEAEEAEKRRKGTEGRRGEEGEREREVSKRRP